MDFYVLIGLGAAAALAALVLFCSSWFVVEQSEVVIVERLGKFLRVAEAGFHLKAPILDKLTAPISLRLQQQEIKITSKTKDDVTCSVTIQIQFQVIDAKLSWYSLDDEQAQFASFVKDALRTAIPALSVDELFGVGSSSIAARAEQYLESKIGAYGYKLDQTLVTELTIDASVLQAMNNIQAQQRAKLAAAEAAEGAKITTVKAAEAKLDAAKQEALAEVERAKGVAQANEIIGESLKNNEGYLRYLWIIGLQNESNTTVYVPTEAGLPILEAGKRPSNQS